MKEFILILYVLSVLILPQIYTYLVRSSSYKTKEVVAGAFGLILVFILTIFTEGLIHWGIISFNFK
jgi:hypothetical protein